MPKPKMNKTDFQMACAIGTAFGVVILGVLIIAIFYDPDVLGILVPFAIAGIGFIGWLVGGKFYDRHN